MQAKDSRQMFKNGFQNNEQLIRLTPTQLSDLKKVLVGMLKDFIAVADKYGLAYTLSGGSVLGTVRHKGFIPWDDDIDINLTRKDYNRLLKIFDKELGEKYILCSPEKTPNHGMLCAQIKKKGTLYGSFNELSKPKEECGICIDIFIMENMFATSIGRKLHGMLCLAFGYLSTCRKTYLDYPYIQKYLSDEDGDAGKAFQKKAKIGGLFRWLSLDAVTRAANRCYSLCKNDRSEYVTIPSGRGHYFRETHLRSEICETTKAQFEGILVNIPAGYRTYLTALYGEDYMQLPPEEKRESHPLMMFDLGGEEAK